MKNELSSQIRHVCLHLSVIRTEYFKNTEHFRNLEGVVVGGSIWMDGIKSLKLSRVLQRF